MAFPAQSIGPFRQPAPEGVVQQTGLRAAVGNDVMVNGPTSTAMQGALQRAGNGSSISQRDIDRMKDLVTAGVKAGQSKDEIMRNVPFELREVAAAEIDQQKDPQKFNLFASADQGQDAGQGASFMQTAAGIGGVLKLAVLDMDKHDLKAPMATPAEAALAAQQRKGAGAAVGV